MQEILTINKTKQAVGVKFDPRQNVYLASVDCPLCGAHYTTKGGIERVAVERINLDLIRHHHEAHGLT